MRPYFVRTSKTAHEDYMMSHRPPNAEDGAPAHDLTGGGDIYPEDVYTHPQYYENMNSFGARQVHQTLKAIRGNPEANVDIYRASPSPVINPGDWVSMSHQYASQHAISNNTGESDMPIYKQTVKAKDIHTNGDSLHEWGYNGSTPLQGIPVKPARIQSSLDIKKAFFVRKAVSSWNNPVAPRSNESNFFRPANDEAQDELEDRWTQNPYVSKESQRGNFHSMGGDPLYESAGDDSYPSSLKFQGSPQTYTIHPNDYVIGAQGNNLNHMAVSSYRDRIANGEIVSPPTAFLDPNSGHTVIIDGNHRTMASRLENKPIQVNRYTVDNLDNATKKEFGYGTKTSKLAFFVRKSTPFPSREPLNHAENWRSDAYSSDYTYPYSTFGKAGFGSISSSPSASISNKPNPSYEENPGKFSASIRKDSDSYPETSYHNSPEEAKAHVENYMDNFHQPVPFDPATYTPRTISDQEVTGRDSYGNGRGSQSISDYNKSLVNPNKGNVDEEFFANLDHTARNSPLPEATILHRGMNVAGPLASSYENLKPGDTVPGLGFASASSNPDIAHQFSLFRGDHGGHSSHVFHINAPAGFPGYKMPYAESPDADDENDDKVNNSGFRDEDETLLPRGTSFTVTHPSEIDQQGVNHHYVTPNLNQWDAQNRKAVTPPKLSFFVRKTDVSPQSDSANWWQTNAGYERVNDALRNGRAVDPEDKVHVSNLIDSIQKSPLEKPLTVYRGIANLDPASSNFISKLKPGRIFREHGFSSTTTNPETASFFSKDDRGTPGAIMAIHLPVGHPALEMPKYAKEDEYLLHPEQSFKVNNVEQTTNKDGSSQPIYHVYPHSYNSPSSTITSAVNLGRPNVPGVPRILSPQEIQDRGINPENQGSQQISEHNKAVLHPNQINKLDKPFFDNLDYTATQAKTPKAMTLYRGVDMHSPQAQAQFGNLKPGDTFGGPTFSSASERPDVAHAFANNNNHDVSDPIKGGTVFKIQTPQGFPALKMPDYHNNDYNQFDNNSRDLGLEKERLFPRNTTFQVTKTEQGQNAYGGNMTVHTVVPSHPSFNPQQQVTAFFVRTSAFDLSTYQPRNLTDEEVYNRRPDAPNGDQGIGNYNYRLQHPNIIGTSDQEFMNNLDHTVRGSSLPQDTVLHRGLRIGSDNPQKSLFDNLKPGDTIPSHGFSSTSLNPDVGKRFSGWGSDSHILHIATPAGFPAYKMPYSGPDSYLANEQEMLLPRGTSYTVNSSSVDDSGVHHHNVTPHLNDWDLAAQKPIMKSSKLAFFVRNTK